MVFATDVDEESLSIARAGLYPAAIAADVSPARLRRYFTQEDHHFRVKQRLRESITFAQQNLLADPPFSRLHLISCRNVLMYVESSVRHRLLQLLHFALAEGGYLVLGSAETAGARDDLFQALSKKWHVYQCIGPARRPAELSTKLGATPLPARLAPARAAEPVTDARLARLTQWHLLEQYAPACVVIDRRHQILYFHGQTGEYLAQPSGPPTRDLLAHARRGLAPRLRAAVEEAFGAASPATLTTVARMRRGTATVAVKITIEPLLGARPKETLLLVAFEDVAPSSGAAEASAGPGQPAQELEHELEATRKDLQAALVDAQDSNEALQAANEEALSLNEELQSSVEELQTSKEELQSLNEELSTVNAQLESKVEELEHATNDLDNLLASTNIPTLFLGRDLTIRRFPPAATHLFRLIASDVLRPLNDVAWNFEDAELITDAAHVLEALVPREREIRTRDGRWYMRQILPYRTKDQGIDGVVVTFSNVAAAAVEAARVYAESIVDTVRSALLVLDRDLRVRSANRAFYELFRTSADRTEGRMLFELDEACWDVPPLRAVLRALRRTRKPFSDLQVDILTPGGGRRIMLLNGRRFADDERRVGQILLAIEDATTRLEAERAVAANEAAMRAIVDTAVDAIITIDGRGTVLSFNRAAERMFGFEAGEIVGKKVNLLMAEPDRSRYERYLRRFARTGQARVIGIGREVTGLRRDGTPLALELAVAEQVRTDAERRFTGMLRDISERKRREREFATQLAVSRVLASSRLLPEATPRLLQVLCEGLGWKVGELWHVDTDAKRLSWDGMWHVASVSGRKLDRTETTTRALTDNLPGRVWSSGKPIVVPDVRRDAELSRESSALELGLTAAFAFPLLARGAVVGVMAFFGAAREPPSAATFSLLEIVGQQVGDFVALKLAEDAADRHRGELARVRPIAALGELASALAHELNQPLSAVANDVESCAAYLRGGRANPTKLRQLLARAGAQAVRAGEVVHRIRELVRRREPVVESCDLRDVAATVVDLMGRESARRKIRVILDAPPRAAVPVRVDRIQIEQVLLNLVQNALDATEAAAPRRREVSVAVAARGDTAEVGVRDHGAGISKAAVDRVFEPFFTTKATGMGMGLAISRSIVEAHHGRIWVAPSRRGGGAAVCFTLPLERRPQTRSHVSGQ